MSQSPVIPAFVTAGNGAIINILASTVAHLEAHPDVGELIAEAAALLTPTGGYIATDVDMGRTVGLSGCVPAPVVDLDTPTTFALRVNRPRPSRVVVGANKVPSPMVSIIAKPIGVGEYELITAWCGPLAPKEPGDCQPGAEFDNSFQFWASNALIWDAETAGEVIVSTWREVLGL